MSIQKTFGLKRLWKYKLAPYKNLKNQIFYGGSTAFVRLDVNLIFENIFKAQICKKMDGFVKSAGLHGANLNIL